MGTCAVSADTSHEVSKPFLPITKWGKLPSVPIPKYFDEGHIHHHSVECMIPVPSCMAGADDADSDDEVGHEFGTVKAMKRWKSLLFKWARW